MNPVRGRTPAATARADRLAIEPLERRRGDLPRELTRALDVALDPDPDERGTLAELHEALDRSARAGIQNVAPPSSARRPPGGSEESLLELESPRARQDAPNAVDRPPEHARAPRGSPGVDRLPARRRGLAGGGGAQRGVAAAARRGRAAAPAPAPLGPGLARRRAFAPVLGLAGLAGAFPALAGQRATWRARAALAALGFWWLALAEPLLTRRLWLGPPTGVPPRGAWEASFGKAASDVVGRGAHARAPHRRRCVGARGHDLALDRAGAERRVGCCRRRCVDGRVAWPPHRCWSAHCSPTRANRARTERSSGRCWGVRWRSAHGLCAARFDAQHPLYARSPSHAPRKVGITRHGKNVGVTTTATLRAF